MNSETPQNTDPLEKGPNKNLKVSIPPQNQNSSENSSPAKKKDKEEELEFDELMTRMIQKKAANRSMTRIKLRKKFNASLTMKEQIMLKLRADVMAELGIDDPLDKQV